MYIFYIETIYLQPSSGARGGRSTTIPLADKPVETWKCPFVSLAMCHLYVTPLAFWELRARAPNSKERFKEMPIITRPTSDDGSTTKTKLNFRCKCLKIPREIDFFYSIIEFVCEKSNLHSIHCNMPARLYVVCLSEVINQTITLLNVWSNINSSEKTETLKTHEFHP